jgi:uncharacterized membrane protein YphA (DoxX/SURF4 family)
MRRDTNIRLKKIIVEVICFLFTLLFVYAALSKLLDFDNFQVQMGQSPLLSAFAVPLSFAVIGIEFLVSILLSIHNFKRAGLYLSYLLMLMFTVYIVIILNYSSFIPCSCGGILEKLGWKEHLIFNIAFTLLALAGILLRERSYKTHLILVSGSIMSIVFMIGLYVISERRLHYENPFIRRFDKDAVIKMQQIELKYHNHYFAGSVPGKIYLGNTSAPLELLEYDIKTKSTILHTLEIEYDNYSFRAVHIVIAAPYFYVSDGTVPVIFKGEIGKWKARQIMYGDYFFSRAIPVEKNKLAFRAQDRKNRENILGLFSFKNQVHVSLSDKILQKQVDGIFDTDGTMTYDPILKKVIYTYYYRNQFMIVSDSLRLEYRGKTIDTVSRASLRITYLKDTRQRRPSVPATTVNKFSTAYDSRLFINSTVRGKLEPLNLWKTSSFIDVYDIKKRSYITSFYIKDLNGNKVNDVWAGPDGFFALLDKTIIYYKINKKLK